MFQGFPDYNLNGLITFNSGVADAFGSLWYMDGDLAGWDSADGRVTMLTRIGTGPNADGEYPADQHYRGRTLSFKLKGCASSEANREASKYLLAQAVDLIGATGTFTVNEETPKAVTISRSGNSNQGKLTMTNLGFSSLEDVVTPGFPLCDVEESTGLRYIWEADVEVYCADPRKYAVTPVTIAFSSYVNHALTWWGAPAFVNPGNTESSRIAMTINGAGAGALYFSGSGGPFFGPFTGLSLAVPSTPGPALPGFPGVLDIDAYAQTIEDNAGNNFYYLRNLLFPYSWAAIVPGTNYLRLDSGLNGRSGSFTYYPAWV